LLLSQTDPQGKEVYSLAPVFIGWFEFYMAGEDSPEREKFARRVRRYFDSFKKYNIPPLRGLHNLQARFTRPPQVILPLEPPSQPLSGNRKIVLDRSLAIPASEVHPPSSVLQIIEKYGAHEAIALIRCFCREMSRRNRQPCQFQLPSESCIVLGPMVEHAVRYGIGRRITKEAALAKIREAAELGAMHTVFQQANLGGPQEVAICNCCRDCCVVLGSNAQGIVPLRYKAFWRVRVANPDRCSHCGECARRCPVDAIRTADREPRVDNSRCVGCGQCTNNCPTGTLELIPDERYVLLPLTGC
jgi:ferredoxin